MTHILSNLASWGSGLWGELDLTALEGWDLQGVHAAGPLRSPRGDEVEDAVTLDVGKTFLGVVQRFLDPEQSLKLYWALYRVHVESRAWNARGPRILERMAQQRPTLLALQEYDVHSLATGSYGSFREAMDGLGYDGALFLGPGQERNHDLKASKGLWKGLKRPGKGGSWPLLAEGSRLPAGRPPRGPQAGVRQRDGCLGALKPFIDVNLRCLWQYRPPGGLGTSDGTLSFMLIQWLLLRTEGCWPM